jgi:DNA-binding NarL/FixJ family response regulator
MTISVLLAEDNDIMRKAIASVLTSDPEIELCAEAASFTQTIQLLRKFQPKVVVMDIHMTDQGSAILSEVKSCLKSSTLLAISLWDDAETKVLADSYGAAEFLDKANLGIELIATIKRCAQKSISGLD